MEQPKRVHFGLNLQEWIDTWIAKDIYVKCKINCLTTAS